MRKIGLVATKKVVTLKRTFRTYLSKICSGVIFITFLTDAGPGFCGGSMSTAQKLIRHNYVAHLVALPSLTSSMTLRGSLSSEFITKATGIKLKSNLSNFAAHEEPTPISDDKFTREFLSNRIAATQFQKLILSAGASLASLIDPHRHDMIACLGETTGADALNSILTQMKNCDEGQRILKDKPRINSKEIDLESLGKMPEDTFGFHYKQFLDDNHVTPDSRMPVRFMDDPELAYVMTRYRECHDLVHTILGMPTNMLGEVSVKWVEALNTGLPMCYGGAIFGAMRLRPKQRLHYSKYYLPWALECGRKAKPLLNVFWEQRWMQRIDDLRSELNIPLLQIPTANTKK